MKDIKGQDYSLLAAQLRPIACKLPTQLGIVVCVSCRTLNVFIKEFARQVTCSLKFQLVKHGSTQHRAVGRDIAGERTTATTTARETVTSSATAKAENTAMVRSRSVTTVTARATSTATSTDCYFTPIQPRSSLNSLRVAELRSIVCTPSAQLGFLEC